MNFENIIDLIKYVNKQRLENKNKWLFLAIAYRGRNITIKSYNTWIQILFIGEKQLSGSMDISVKDYKTFLTNSILKYYQG